ncbi:hypothetical protein [Kutzneria sp. CA-103260]|uniref:hypothetical protein n=1 Tax=Kutzneria sp. CA-103260 TaxID=2802641 RepID=UPI001BAB0420|nr:hypothetical protein [Kutzneria sp. CA-103260]
MVGAVVALLVTALVACSDPATAPRPAATSTTPPELVAGIDPCALISLDQAKELRLNAPHRSDSPGHYAECSWSTLFGSAVSVSLEEQAHTVEQFVDSERVGEPPTPEPAMSPWTGDRHHGTALDWKDGHRIGVVIIVSPAQIATVDIYSSDPGQELGRPITAVLRETAAVVDRNLPT